MGKHRLTQRSESSRSDRPKVKARKISASKGSNPQSSPLSQTETIPLSVINAKLELSTPIDLTAKCGHLATSFAHDLLQSIRSKIQAKHLSDFHTAIIIQAELILDHVSAVLNVDPESEQWDLGPMINIGMEVLPRLERCVPVYLCVEIPEHSHQRPLVLSRNQLSRIYTNRLISYPPVNTSSRISSLLSGQLTSGELTCLLYPLWRPPLGGKDIDILGFMIVIPHFLHSMRNSSE